MGDTHTQRGINDTVFMADTSYLYVAGGLARARQLMVIFASGDSSG